MSAVNLDTGQSALVAEAVAQSKTITFVTSPTNGLYASMRRSVSSTASRNSSHAPNSIKNDIHRKDSL